MWGACNLTSGLLNIAVASYSKLGKAEKASPREILTQVVLKVLKVPRKMPNLFPAHLQFKVIWNRNLCCCYFYSVDVVGGSLELTRLHRTLTHCGDISLVVDVFLFRSKLYLNSTRKQTCCKRSNKPNYEPRVVPIKKNGENWQKLKISGRQDKYKQCNLGEVRSSLFPLNMFQCTSVASWRKWWLGSSVYWLSFAAQHQPARPQACAPSAIRACFLQWGYTRKSSAYIDHSGALSPSVVGKR